MFFVVFLPYFFLFLCYFILFYSFWSCHIYKLFYPSNTNLDFKCGNSLIGTMMFQWIIGIPLVYIFQKILNKYLHKINLLAKKIESEISN